MEIIKLTLITLIFVEVTILLIKNLHKPFINPNAKRKVYIDTSALMDGRILAIAETGFIGDDLIIPRSVVRELQLMLTARITKNVLVHELASIMSTILSASCILI